MQMKYLPNTASQPPSLLRKAVALVAAMALFALALMFSALLIAVVLTVGAIAWAYLWWRTRDLRKQMRMHSPDGVVIEGEAIKGEVIEGEVIRKAGPGDRG